MEHWRNPVERICVKRLCDRDFSVSRRRQGPRSNPQAFTLVYFWARLGSLPNVGLRARPAVLPSFPGCSLACVMPFDSPHWTLVESIVWIATRDERRVDALTLIGRNSLMLLYTDEMGSATLSGKEGRKARTELINALGASKFVATGIVLAAAAPARKEIPSFDWPNIRLSETRHFNRMAWEWNMRMVDEAYIIAELKIAGQIVRAWRDVRVSRTAVLSEWPRAERTVQALSADTDVQAVQPTSARTTLAVQATSPGAITTVQAEQGRQAAADQNRIAASDAGKEDLSQANQQQAGASNRLPFSVAVDSMVPDVEGSGSATSVPEERYPSVRVRKNQLNSLMRDIHANQIPTPTELANILKTGRTSDREKAKCSRWIKERLQWPLTKSKNDTGDKDVRNLLHSIEQAGGLVNYVGKLSCS